MHASSIALKIQIGNGKFSTAMGVFRAIAQLTSPERCETESSGWLDPVDNIVPLPLMQNDSQNMCCKQCL